MKWLIVFLVVALAAPLAYAIIEMVIDTVNQNKLRPKAVTIDPNGNIFVGYSNDDNAVIRRMDSHSGEVNEWRIVKPRRSDEIGLQDLEADEKHVYVSIWEFRRPQTGFLRVGSYYDSIYKFNHQGEELARWDGTEAIGGRGPFHEARSLALGNQTLYIADTNSHAIRGVDLDGFSTILWGSDGLTILVSRDENGNVLSADWKKPNLRIMPVDVVAGDGLAVIDMLGGKDQIRWFNFLGQEIIEPIIVKDDLESLAMTVDGLSLYVVQGEQVAHYRRLNNELLSAGQRIGMGHKLNNPRDIAVDKEGRVYVVDSAGVHVATREDPYWENITAFSSVEKTP